MGQTLASVVVPFNHGSAGKTPANCCACSVSVILSASQAANNGMMLTITYVLEASCRTTHSDVWFYCISDANHVVQGQCKAELAQLCKA